ncbi:endonuclease-reverse transcriptase [Elysia marginata]|uniref:Endonuclease-reverse transcriptase n=1 Tax=Elysia marginata TaxID=1093978 RepID=A0AAV4J4A8_9GAST|nr:endonuclease-reverse transcriptase [Elysia marginata]
MKECGQSRKDSTHPIASSSIKSLRIASWNARTLYQAGKTAQLTTEMKRYRLHILGVSETHWIQSGQKTLGSGELILFSGREHKQHSESVALVLGKYAQKSLRGWEPHGERIIMASFQTRSKNINMNIVQIYAPTNEAQDEEKDALYVARKTEATPQEARKSKGSAKETIPSKSPEWCYKGRFQTVLEE